MLCNNGHQFDPAQNARCPYCPVPGLDLGSIELDYNQQRRATDPAPETPPAREESPKMSQTPKARTTIPWPFRNTEPAVAGESGRSQVTDKGRTDGRNQVDPVVGWLVAIDGPCLGRDFRVFCGSNKIGREKDQDVCLSDDGAVHGEKHAFIIFDLRANQFLFKPGDGRNLVYYDDNTGQPGEDNFKLVHDTIVLEPFWVLQIGDSKLVFVPFCGEKFVWNLGRPRS
jgi:hypothetical protein